MYSKTEHMQRKVFNPKNLILPPLAAQNQSNSLNGCETKVFLFSN